MCIIKKKARFCCCYSWNSAGPRFACDWATLQHCAPFLLLLQDAASSMRGVCGGSGDSGNVGGDSGDVGDIIDG